MICDTALKRKGKGSDVEEADMDAVVHAHNSKCHLSDFCSFVHFNNFEPGMVYAGRSAFQGGLHACLKAAEFSRAGIPMSFGVVMWGNGSLLLGPD